MHYNQNTIFTDSLERELINHELDYYNDAPLSSFFRWVGAGAKSLQDKLISYVAGASTELSRAHK